MNSIVACVLFFGICTRRIFIEKFGVHSEFREMLIYSSIYLYSVLQTTKVLLDVYGDGSVLSSLSLAPLLYLACLLFLTQDRRGKAGETRVIYNRRRTDRKEI